MKNEYLKPTVPLKYQNNVKNFTFRHAIHKVVSVLHNLDCRNKSKITAEDEEVQFLLFNINNGLETAVKRILRKNIQIREEFKSKNKEEAFYRVTIIFTLFTTMAIGSWILIYLALRTKNRALKAFYGFDEAYLRSLIKKIEKYMNFIHSEMTETDKNQIEDFDDHVSSEEEQLAAEKNPKSILTTKFRKDQKLRVSTFFKGVKKRKLKGSAVRLFGLWQALTLGFGISNFLLFWKIGSQKIGIISAGSQASDFITTLISFYDFSITFRNTLQEVLLNPEAKNEGRNALAALAGYQAISADRMMNIFKVATNFFNYFLSLLLSSAQLRTLPEIKSIGFLKEICARFIKNTRITISKINFRSHARTLIISQSER